MTIAAAIRYYRERERTRVAGGVSILTAADFIHGGGPRSARLFDRKGGEIAGLDRLDGEGFEAFRERARQAARAGRQAARVVMGGLSIGDDRKGFLALPRAAVSLPDVPLHGAQIEALRLIEASRRTCLVCGRRFGKTTLLDVLAVGYAIQGRSVEVFAPTFKLLRPLLDAIAFALAHIPGVAINRALGEIRLPGGGAIDFWSLDHTGRAARGRKYHLVLVDEAAHDEGYLADTLEAAIAPALIDYRGSIVLASTPAGLEGAFWESANVPEKGYAVFHAPTAANPHLPADEIAYLRSTLRPEIAAQELDALFVDVSGASIFPLANLLIDGGSHADMFPCQAIGLAIDSNSGKGGPDRDGAAAVIFGLTLPHAFSGSIEGARVVLLDWDIQSLAQGGVGPWIQTMKTLTLQWAYRLKPLSGLPRAYVEGAGNGYSIIEAARVQGLNPQEIEAQYVLLGKDGRALAAEPHVSGGRVKIGAAALAKRSSYRGVVANHLTGQLTGFKAFDRDSYKREDDLFDAAIYAVLCSLGDGTEARWAKLKRAA